MDHFTIPFSAGVLKLLVFHFPRPSFIELPPKEAAGVSKTRAVISLRFARTFIP